MSFSGLLFAIATFIFFLSLRFIHIDAVPRIDSNEITEDIVNPQVTTKYGTVEGFGYVTPMGVKADIFLGVPYAQPPVGELRLEVSK